MTPEDTAKPSALTPETAPDPDEDDLDDLDEMLDEFAATKINQPKTDTPGSAAPTTTTISSAPDPSGPGRPHETKTVDDAGPGAEEEDFAQQLQAGMAEMLKNFETNPEMAKQFEDIMAQFGAPPPPTTTSTAAPASPKPAKAASATPQPASSPAASTSASAKPQDEAFQDTIRRTMERMRDSSTTAAAASSTPGPGDDAMMAQLMAAMGAAGEGGDGDDAFSKMLLGMMEQLTNKEVLYDPMKELDSKFPAWLQANRASLSAADRDRYETQQTLVREIVGKFETPGYSDDTPAHREYIVDRMQKMQAAGAPPPDLVGDVNAAEEMFGGADSGCPQQ